MPPYDLSSTPEIEGPRPEPAIPRILVIDDHPDMLRLMERALSDTYECEFAADIEQAHARLSTGAFQLSICNIDSPGAAGLALAGEIVEKYPDTATVVLMTGADDPETAREAFGLGVSGYLVEPFWPGQLLITVMSALRRRELEMNSEDRSQTIIDMAPIPIYAKDADGNYIVANAMADELSGKERGELVGLTDEALLPPEDLDVGTSSDRRVFDEQVAHEREDTVTIGGVKKTFKTVRFPLFDENGRVDAAGGISVDITAEREAMRLRDELSATQERAIEELRLSRQETIEGLSQAIDLHDSSTGEHVVRMAAIASFLGRRLGLDAERVSILEAASPMHDVGKIGIRAEILRKPGPLTAAERTEVERHTVIGHAIFSQFESELSRVAASIALTHHERYDGSGYPHGLIGEEIPLEGRLTAVADVFDALLSDRAYRRALSVEEAIEVMRDGNGTHFDPEIVGLLLDNIDEVLAVR